MIIESYQQRSHLYAVLSFGAAATFAKQECRDISPRFGGTAIEKKKKLFILLNSKLCGIQAQTLHRNIVTNRKLDALQAMAICTSLNICLA